MTHWTDDWDGDRYDQDQAQDLAEELYPDWDTCPDCDGVGEIDDCRCVTCNGVGDIVTAV